MNESLYISAFDGRVPAELACDYILPDTYPDIRRILRVSASPVLIGRYAAAKRLEWNGAVDYLVTFSADSDAGESLHTVHFAGEWSGALTLPDGTEGCELLLTPTVAGCAARPVNPRKVSLKATVLTDLRILRPVSAEPRIDGSAEDAARLERLTETVPVLRERAIIAEPRHVSENLEPDAAQPAIAEIVSCTARIHFHEARLSRDDTLTVRLMGTAHMDCLYLGADGSCRSFSRKLPLSYQLGVPECADFFAGCAPETLTVSADAVLTELAAAAGDNSYGERRVAEVDFTFEPHLHLTGVTMQPLVLDAYSTARSVEIAPRELEFCRAARVMSTNFSVSEAVEAAGMRLPEGCVPLDAAGTVTFRALTPERGRAILTGDAAVSCIFAAPDGSFIPAEAVIPVKCELACDVSEPFAMEARGIVSDLRVRVEPERLQFDFEVSLTLTVRERLRRVTAEAVTFGEALPSAKPCAGMVLCYPAAGESLWSIAKRYGVAVSALEAANPEAARVVVIPRGGISGVV